MASMAMTPAFLRGTAPKHPSTTTTTTTGRQRGVIVMAKASKVSEGVSFKNEHDSGSGRRDLVFAAAAAAVWSVAKVAAAVEPKPGSPEAKKKYAAVCVTMPTARICRKGPSTS